MDRSRFKRLGAPTPQEGAGTLLFVLTAAETLSLEVGSYVYDIFRNDTASPEKEAIVPFSALNVEPSIFPTTVGSITGSPSPAPSPSGATVKVTAADTIASFLDPAITAGAGLTKTVETLGGDETLRLDVAANADGSILANANDIQVGILATDGQHGVRGGGTLHAQATAAADGFMAAVDKSKLDGIAAGAQPDQTISAGAGLTGGGSGDPINLDVAANADGSIVVNANDIQVGVLAMDAQHGNLGGGSLHALVVAGGAAGFMAGADKTKLDGVASGASATFTGLTDTAGALVADDFARVNAGGTSVDMFDLFGTANTWTAAQTINAQLNMGGDVLPTSSLTRDIGSGSLRFRRVQGQIASFVAPAGISTVALPANTTKGGLLAGTQGGVGTNVHRLDGGSFPAIACIGNTVTNNAAGSATLRATKGGAIAFGSAYAYGASGVALIQASGYSSFTAGYAYGSGSSTLEATKSGSLAFGYANGRSGSALVRATGTGGFVAGMARQQSSTGSSTLQAGGTGSFAQGYARCASANAALVRATGTGSFAQGAARVDGAFNATIEATAAGAFAQGYARATSIGGATALVQSSAKGAFAVGYAGNTTIAATAQNAAQFGPGTNSLADSLQVGSAGLRLKGTLGAPGTPQNGDIWVAAGYTYIRSNGVSVKIV